MRIHYPSIIYYLKSNQRVMWVYNTNICIIQVKFWESFTILILIYYSSGKITIYIKKTTRLICLR